MVPGKWRDGEFCRRYAPVHGVHAEDACIDVVDPVSHNVKVRRIILTQIDTIHDFYPLGFAHNGYAGRIFRGMGFVFLLLGTDALNLSLPVLQ